jgi:hypothetical protein
MPSGEGQQDDFHGQGMDIPGWHQGFAARVGRAMMA